MIKFDKEIILLIRIVCVSFFKPTCVAFYLVTTRRDCTMYGFYKMLWVFYHAASFFIFNY